MLARILLTLAVTLPLLAAAPARAHIVIEDPWNPVAAAYRASIFMADLTPPPWNRIRANWEAAYPNAVNDTPAAALIDAVRKSVAKPEDGFAVKLLDGVTGSGKTEVYFEAIAAMARYITGTE